MSSLAFVPFSLASLMISKAIAPLQTFSRLAQTGVFHSSTVIPGAGAVNERTIAVCAPGLSDLLRVEIRASADGELIGVRYERR